MLGRGFYDPRSFSLMKISKTTTLGAVLLIVAVLVLWNKQQKEAPRPNQELSNDKNSSRPSNADSTSPVGKQEVSRKPPTSDTGNPDDTKEVILEKIHNTSVTYDPKELPKIVPYLNHDDPEVRRAAIDGMIVLGDSSAGNYLRAASKTARTPHEAVALEEAANYIELPPSKNFKLRKKVQPKN